MGERPGPASHPPESPSHATPPSHPAEWAARPRCRLLLTVVPAASPGGWVCGGGDLVSYFGRGRCLGGDGLRRMSGHDSTSVGIRLPYREGCIFADSRRCTSHTFSRGSLSSGLRWLRSRLSRLSCGVFRVSGGEPPDQESSSDRVPQLRGWREGVALWLARVVRR